LRVRFQRFQRLAARSASRSPLQRRNIGAHRILESPTSGGFLKNSIALSPAWQETLDRNCSIFLTERRCGNNAPSAPPWASSNRQPHIGRTTTSAVSSRVQLHFGWKSPTHRASACRQTAEDRCDRDLQLESFEWLTEVDGTKIGRWPVAEAPLKLKPHARRISAASSIAARPAMRKTTNMCWVNCSAIRLPTFAGLRRRA